jgi:hypothetical protein
MHWIDLAQDRDMWRELVNAAMDIRVPQNSGNFLTSREPVSFSGRTLLHGVSKQACWLLDKTNRFNIKKLCSLPTL